MFCSLCRRFTSQQVTWLMLMLTVVMLVVSVYMQYALGLLPCMICELQRYLLVPIALVLVLQVCSRPQTLLRRLTQSTVLFLIVLEVALSIRHLLLLYVPTTGPTVRACLPGLLTYAHNASWLQALTVALQGSGEGCHQVTWHFLALSLPEWTAISMTVLLAMWCWARCARR